ncbi:MAG: membrane protein insertase YidC, partial [Ketobacteraceae bacterium]|nr:membrane protein insertase YidC [Ketobacteraceae bacterium]
MEIQRALVLTAIAVVTYMMILAWQRDYSDLPEAPSSVASQQQPAADIPEANDETVTAQEAGAVPSEQDIPAAGDTASLPEADTTPTTTSANMEVLVKTDVMTAVIDRRGGDITHVELPQYPRSAATPDIPMTLLEQSALRTYIAQTGLVGKNGTDTQDGRPTWSSEQSTYTLSPPASELNVDLTLYQEGNVKIIKRYTFTRDSYLVRISHIIINNGSEVWQGALYGQLRRDGTDDPSMNNAGFVPMPTYLGGAYWTEEKPFNKIDFEDIREEPIKMQQQGGWIALLQHYFVSAWIPDPVEKNTYSTVYLPNKNEYLLRFVSPAEKVQPEQQSVLYAELYMGPKDQDVLESISPGLNMTVDYGWLWFIAQPIFAVLVFLQSG